MLDPIQVSPLQIIAVLVFAVFSVIYAWLAAKGKYFATALDNETLPLGRNYILRECSGKGYAMLEDHLTGKLLVYKGLVPTHIRQGDTFVRSRAPGGDIQWLVYAPVTAPKQGRSSISTSTEVAAMASGG